MANAFFPSGVRGHIDMQNCPNCGKENPAGEAYCYGCGHILPEALADVIDSTTHLQEAIERLEPQRRWGTAYFSQQTQMQLTFRDSGEKLLLTIDQEMVLGRHHNAPGVDQPDIDLGPYRAMEKGVSRRHLAVKRDQGTIVISDMGSANHSYLNGQRLLPHEPRILRDNDELRLGHLVIKVEYV